MNDSPEKTPEAGRAAEREVGMAEMIRGTPGYLVLCFGVGVTTVRLNN